MLSWRFAGIIIACLAFVVAEKIGKGKGAAVAETAGNDELSYWHA